MAGGTIFEKDITANVQNNKDKSLIIDPNYAYQVPFQFLSDWEDIKIGMFVSYVKNGVGNENVGVPTSSILSAGGTSSDTFNYVGIMKSGVVGDAASLPLESTNSGFLGLQASDLHVLDTSSTAYNKLYHKERSANTAGVQANNLGDANFIATHGATILESGNFQDTKGNFNVVSIEDYSSISSQESCTERPVLFCDYWGMSFKVINKGQSNQMIRFTASINGSTAGANRHSSFGAISDPSIEALKGFMNGVNEFSFMTTSSNLASSNNMHPNDQGFAWNNGSSAYALPDSLFFYNAFTDLRPRIHAWAAKKIS